MSEDGEGAASADSVAVEDATAAFREAREYARGELDVSHHDVHPHAGLVDDDELRAVLSWMADHYDPSEAELEAGLPRSFWDTEFAQKAIRKHATERLDKAIHEGNVTQTSYLSGLPSYKSDVSGLHAINQLADWLVNSEQCKLIYLAALMGRGKTDLSLTLLEVVHDHYRRITRSVEDVEIPTPEFAANFHVETPEDVDSEVQEFHSYDELDEWAERGDSDQVRWFIFDEASTELTAQSGANAQKVAETMAPFVKKMRKNGVDMIVIGHDKGDVHPAIRSLADFVDKTGLKTASFYAGINNREPQGHLFSVDGIPPTSWTFDTDDTATWSWGDEEAEERIEVGMSDDEFKSEVAERAARVWLRTPDEVTQQDVAEAVSNDRVSISRGTISNYARDIEKGNTDTNTAIAD